MRKSTSFAGLAVVVSVLLIVLVLLNRRSDPPASVVNPADAPGENTPDENVPAHSPPPEAPMEQPLPANTMTEENETKSEPGPIRSLRDWMAAGGRDEAGLNEGIRLAEQRRKRMREWIEEDPERALAESLHSWEVEALPPEIRERVERPVSGTGFYGVGAICNHEPGEAHGSTCEIFHEVAFGMGTASADIYKASIYGHRESMLTREEAPIFGVALDDRIAVHEDDVVLRDEGDNAPGGRYAVYAGERVTRFDDLPEATAEQTRLQSAL